MTDIPWDWSGTPRQGDAEAAFQQRHREVLAILETHGEREGAALDAYALLVEQSGDKGIRYLGQLLLEDEERHHRIIAEMVNSLRSFLEQREVEPRLPSMVGPVVGDTLAETKRLLEFEKEDLAELRSLRKDLKRGTAYRLLSLMVELMIHDTRKHIEILEYICDSA